MRLQRLPVTLPNTSDHSRFLSVDQVAATHRGEGLSRMSLSIMAIGLEEHIKAHSIYGTSINFHRSVLLAPISGAMIKLPTVCNAA